jgi:hypothetical protein
MFLAKRKSLSESELIALAKRECEQEGWPWLEPVHIQNRMFRWIILTNSLEAGGNVEIIVDKKSGAMVRKCRKVAKPAQQKQTYLLW